MITTDSHVFRFAASQIDIVWRQQREEAAGDRLTSAEIFAAYLDELLDDRQEPDFGSPASSTPPTFETIHYIFDDILRQAIVAEGYAPLG